MGVKRKNYGQRKNGIKGGNDNRKWQKKDDIFLLQNRTLVATHPQWMCEMLDRKMTSIQRRLKELLLMPDNELQEIYGNAIILSDGEDVVTLTKDDYDKLYADYNYHRRLNMAFTCHVSVMFDTLIGFYTMEGAPKAEGLIELLEKARKSNGIHKLSRAEQEELQARISRASNLLELNIPIIGQYVKENPVSFDNVMNGEVCIPDEVMAEAVEMMFKNIDSVLPNEHKNVSHLKAS